MDKITVERFRALFPEFNDAPHEVVAVRLEWAQARFNPTAFSSKYEQIVYNYAAHLISLAPGGKNMRLNKTDGETNYSATVKELEKLHIYKAGFPY